MKKFLPVVVVALLIAAGATPKASAWCKFNWSCGCNLSFEKGGESDCSIVISKHHYGQPPCEGCPYGYPIESYAAPQQQQQQQFPPAPKPADKKDGNQPAGYWNGGYGYNPYYTSPSTGYTTYPMGYGAAPSYWYGQ